MTLTCTTTDTTPFEKSPAFFLEVGKSYPIEREQFFNGIKCFILKDDPIGALYPSFLFENDTITAREFLENTFNVDWMTSEEIDTIAMAMELYAKGKLREQSELKTNTLIQ